MIYGGYSYPAGAEYESSPYQLTRPHKFNVEVFQVLFKNDIPLVTDDYEEIEDEEESSVYITRDTDWEAAMFNNDMHTPIELLSLFKDCLEKQLKSGNLVFSDEKTKRLIQECDGWVANETVIDEA